MLLEDLSEYWLTPVPVILKIEIPRKKVLILRVAEIFIPRYHFEFS